MGLFKFEAKDGTIFGHLNYVYHLKLRKLGKMSQNLSCAALVIGALRVKM